MAANFMKIIEILIFYGNKYFCPAILELEYLKSSIVRKPTIHFPLFGKNTILYDGGKFYVCGYNI